MAWAASAAASAAAAATASRRHFHLGLRLLAFRFPAAGTPTFFIIILRLPALRTPIVVAPFVYFPVSLIVVPTMLVFILFLLLTESCMHPLCLSKSFAGAKPSLAATLHLFVYKF